METPMDNCMHCGRDYALIKENARLQLFVRNPEMNYIQAQCPHCEGWSRIFVSQDTVCDLLASLGLYVYPDAPDELKAAHARIFPSEETQIVPADQEVKTDDLPDIPPQLRRELWDFLRDGDANG